MMGKHSEFSCPNSRTNDKGRADSAVAALATSLSSLQMAGASEVSKPTSSLNAHAKPQVQPGEPPADSNRVLDSDDETQPFGEGDPLFDECADSEDEAWVRTKLLGGEENVQESVSCPRCFSVLSLQAQAHEQYEGQFRAMFVINCRVVASERLRVVVKGGMNSNGEKEGGAEAYRPVACRRCGTEVGVLDTEGVYHLCNVFY